MEIFKSLKTIIDEASKSQIFYQTHTWQNVPIITGIRGVERRSLIPISDIMNKNVLDLGCATGSECSWAVENGANTSTGVDAGDQQVSTFNKIITCLNELNPEIGNKLHGVQHDLSKGVPDYIKKQNIDTLFCFAITQHVKYRKLWHEVPSVKVVFIEGGADSNYTEASLTDNLFEAKEIGRTPVSLSDPRLLRPLFRLIKL